MWLYPGQSYWVRDGYVEIIGGIRLRIIGWDRRYDQYENGGQGLSIEAIR
jgi:hypothetical protein